jgi:hypothetical protein
MKEEVKGEQGLAALALGKFEDEYEIEGIRQIFEKEGDFSPVYKQLIKYIGRRFLHYRSVIGSSTVHSRSVHGRRSMRGRRGTSKLR